MQKSFLLYFLVSLIGLIFIGRLFQLQIIKHESYDPIHNAAVKIVYDYPERGYVYDRNGKLLVANQLSYDVMIQPNQVKPLDTLEFCKLLKISKLPPKPPTFELKASETCCTIGITFSEKKLANFKTIGKRRFCFFARKTT